MTAITLTWAGGEDRFSLRPIARLRALQTAVNRGPEEILNRFQLGTYRDEEVFAVLRHGLIGGGADEDRAGPLPVRLYDEGVPLTELKLTAHAVILHALVGPADDMPGKPGGTAANPPENGGSAGSTDTAP